MQFELTRLAFALAAYHADRGTYPAKLADLVPKYVAEVPKDIFNARSCTTGRKAAATCSTASVSTARMTAARATTTARTAKTGTTWPSACRRPGREAVVRCVHAIALPLNEAADACKAVAVHRLPGVVRTPAKTRFRMIRKLARLPE